MHFLWHAFPVECISAFVLGSSAWGGPHAQSQKDWLTQTWSVRPSDTTSFYK
jgi:hypothetical protein